MQIVVNIQKPYIWYRQSTEEWVVSLTVDTENVSHSQNFANKDKEKAKKAFFRHCNNGLLGEEMRYLFSNNQIEIEER